MRNWPVVFLRRDDHAAAAAWLLLAAVREAPEARPDAGWNKQGNSEHMSAGRGALAALSGEAMADPDRRQADAAWRRRARDMAMEIDLPVAIRIAETRLPLARVATLKPGDVLPRSAPRSFGVMVSGRRFAELPAPPFRPDQAGTEKGTP